MEDTLVGSKSAGRHVVLTVLVANAFGLHDTIGNVIERCRDARIPYAVPARDGDGLRQSGLSPGQAVRGGSFSSLPIRARVAYRSANPLSASDESIGFRLSMAVEAARDR